MGVLHPMAAFVAAIVFGLHMRTAEVDAVDVISYATDDCSGAVLSRATDVPSGSCRVYGSPAIGVQVTRGTTNLACYEVVTYQDSQCQVLEEVAPQIVISTDFNVCSVNKGSGVRVAWFPKSESDCER